MDVFSIYGSVLVLHNGKNVKRTYIMENANIMTDEYKSAPIGDIKVMKTCMSDSL